MHSVLALREILDKRLRVCAVFVVGMPISVTQSRQEVRIIKIV